MDGVESLFLLGEAGVREKICEKVNKKGTFLPLIVLPDRHSCPECEVQLCRVQRKVSRRRIVHVYTKDQGTLPAYFVDYYCPGCQFVFWHGRRVSADGTQLFYSDPDKIQYLLVTADTAFEWKLLETFDIDITIGRQSFLILVKKWNKSNARRHKSLQPIVAEGSITRRGRLSTLLLDKRRVTTAWFCFKLIHFFHEEMSVKTSKLLSLTCCVLPSIWSRERHRNGYFIAVQRLAVS